MDENHNSDSESEDSSNGVRQRGATLAQKTKGDAGQPSDVVSIEYSANIAAACSAVNSESKRARSPSEVHRLEKRRESNRLSARRCRRRRREEMDELSEELKRQSQVNDALALEQKVLKEELEREIQSLQQGNQQRPPPVAYAKVASPVLQHQTVSCQDQVVLQALLSKMSQNPQPNMVAPSLLPMNNVNTLASLLGIPMNAAALGNHPLSQQALAAASVMLGAQAPAAAGYQLASLPPASSPALFPQRAASLNNNDYAAALARMDANMSSVPQQTIPLELLSAFFNGQQAMRFPMHPSTDNGKQRSHES